MASGGRADVGINDFCPEVLAEIIVKHLGTKGFCSIDAGLEPGQLDAALTDVRDVEHGGGFYQPPSLLYEAFLGYAGSAHIAHLSRPDSSSANTHGEHLALLDGLMSELGECLEYDVERLGFKMHSRTPGLLHRSGPPPASHKDLTESEASDWMVQLFRAKIMCLVMLGPGMGSLEMQPFDNKESFSVDLSAGSVVLLRADALSHSLKTSGDCKVLSCFYLGSQALSNKKHSAKEDDLQLTPVAKMLYDWVDGRLCALKEKVEGRGEAETELPDVPESWLQAMNHAYSKGQRTAICGQASRMPGSWNPDEWKGMFTAGPDVVIGIPIMRWNHDKWYEDSPDSWKQTPPKTYCRHGAYADGLELFDPKPFGLSPAESKSMDPTQRWMLEGGYTGLRDAGFVRKTLTNSFGAVYVAAGQSEFGMVEKTGDGISATGGSLAIHANRFSFCLGMRGPSYTYAVDMASGLAAVHVACQNMNAKGCFVAAPFAMIAGIYLNFIALPLCQLQSMGQVSRVGRCSTFNNSADGLVRSDAALWLVAKPNVEKVDDKVVVHDEDPLGEISGTSITHCGKSHWGLPTGPGLIEVMEVTFRNAGLEPTDIDAIECHATGGQMGDPIEQRSISTALNLGSPDHTHPRGIMSMKSATGDLVDANGLGQLLRTTHSIKYGYMKPILHLNQSNPYMELQDDASLLVTECLEFRRRQTYVGLLGYGSSGCNVGIVAWGSMDSNCQNFSATVVKDKLTFWPAGGGQLDTALQPRRDYSIVGSMTNWEAKPMKMVGAGHFTFIVTLGDERWEEFQIWLDGDENRRLVPGTSPGSVLGPDNLTDDENVNSWVIDGHPLGADSGDAAAIENGGDALAATQDFATPDTGEIGSKYNVVLRIVGRYRLVEWSKVQTD